MRLVDPETGESYLPKLKRNIFGKIKLGEEWKWLVDKINEDSKKKREHAARQELRKSLKVIRNPKHE